MENKLERKYSFYITRQGRNAWRLVCPGRIRRHFSQNEVCHKGRVSGLNGPLTHVRRNYCVRQGESKQRTREESNTKHLPFEGSYRVVSNSPHFIEDPPARRSVSQRTSKCVTMRHCAILHSVSLGRIRMYTGSCSLYNIECAHPFYVCSKVSKKLTHNYLRVLKVTQRLTLILLTWRIWWAPNNASK